jgi:AcrR family transcriptional regulator
MARRKGNTQATQDQVSEILKASTLVFGLYGFNGGSLSQIASHLSIGESGILHHFKSKANLLAEVLKYRDQRIVEVSGLHSNIGLGFVSAWLEMVEFNTSDPGNVELFCIVSAEATSHSHPAHEYFKARYDRTVRFATESFKVLDDLGYLQENQDPEDLGHSLVALSDGLQVQWLLDRNLEMLKLHKNFFLRVLTEEASLLLGLEPSDRALFAQKS